jgi:micrococcal nuclease
VPARPVRLTLCAAAFFAVVSTSCTATSPSATSRSIGRSSATVTRVVDGDTVIAQVDGEELRVRLIGIDTPETVAPDQPVECFGPAASEFARGRLEGEDVELEFDLERLDRYGRTLAYVWLGGELFNETLVREGYAAVTTFPPDVKYVDRFVAAQRAAREQHVGLWGACPGAG